LSRRCDQLAGTLSGGQQRMLAIARGLMMRPRLLMSTSRRWGWHRWS
jgi:branched-chain amino acid transport system ATP-binding protein